MQRRECQEKKGYEKSQPWETCAQRWGAPRLKRFNQRTDGRKTKKHQRAGMSWYSNKIGHGRKTSGRGQSDYCAVPLLWGTYVSRGSRVDLGIFKNAGRHVKLNKFKGSLAPYRMAKKGGNRSQKNRGECGKKKGSVQQFLGGKFLIQVVRIGPKSEERLTYSLCR